VAIQYKVPQNIDMQDRVIGPLTMVQFLYAVFGGGFAYISFSSFPSPINILAAFLIAAFTACIIFVKINERPFLSFLGNLISFSMTPRFRVWSKSTTPFKVDVYANPNNQKKTIINEKHISKEDLSKLAETIDKHNPNQQLIKV
jgi:hypothetical protein